MTPREEVAAVAARLRSLSGVARDPAIAAELLGLAARLEAIRVPPEPVAEAAAPCACAVPVPSPGAAFGTCGRPCAPGERTCKRHRAAAERGSSP